MLLSFVLFSQSKAEVVSSNFFKWVDSKGSVKLEYKIRVTDSKGAQLSVNSGAITFEGTSYLLKSELFDVYCNSSTKWIINKADKEISIFANDISQVELLENPLGFIGSIKDNYSLLKSVSDSKIGVEKVEVIQYTPKKGKKSAYNFIKIGMSGASPSLFDIELKSGNRYIIELKAVQSSAKQLGVEFYTLKRENYKGYIFNDLRD